MTHHVRKHKNRFSKELAKHLVPEYEGGAYPQYNPSEVHGLAETANFSAPNNVPDEVAKRLESYVAEKLDLSFRPWADYTEAELRAAWLRRRLKKEWWDRVSALINQQIQVIEAYNQVTPPSSLAEEKLEKELQKILQSRPTRSSSSTVALISVNLSRETLQALEAVNQNFPTFGSLVQVAMKMPKSNDPSHYAAYRTTPLDQYLQLVAPGGSAHCLPKPLKSIPWSNGPRMGKVS